VEQKVALISPHHDPNYGTMLQAYALAKAIENLGFCAEYVSYSKVIRKNLFEKILYYAIHPLKVVNRFRNKKRKKTLDDFSFFGTPEFIDTIRKFEKFYQDYIPHSLIIYNPKTIKNISGYSKYVVGSDQTWSPNLHTSESINLLDFVKDNTLKNAYAPSLGTTNVPEWFQNIIKEKLSGFANLSCREKTNCSLIEKLTGQKVNHVLDPTLLLTTEQWNKVAQNVDMPDKYVLCYILGEKKCISDFAEMLGKKKNIPVYYLVTRPIYLEKQNYLTGIGPTQLISLIKGANYVITDSFHGTIFSINYNRNFYCFAKRKEETGLNDNSRLLEVLKDFDVLKRFKSDGDMELEEDMVFDKINEILYKRRLESTNYLNHIIAD
jgi:hypothetical protein